MKGLRGNSAAFTEGREVGTLDLTKWDFKIAGPDAENWLKIRKG